MTESLVPKNKVIVVDFGLQYGQVIARRVRDLNVYSEVVSYDEDLEKIKEMDPVAIILSGGPVSIHVDNAPKFDPELLNLGVPVLGVGYGMQAMAQALGGAVPKTNKGENGTVALKRSDVASQLLSGTPEDQNVWMNHKDSVGWVPAGFTITSSTATTPIASMENDERKLYAVQFRPDDYRTKYGNQILSNFLFGIAKLERNWNLTSFTDKSVANIRETVGNGKVVLALSGGLDSAVMAALVSRAVGDQLTCILIDNGLMREGEVDAIETAFKRLSGMNLEVADASARYLKALKGVKDPEKKRKIMADEFWNVFFEEAAKIDDVKFIAHPTIYSDILEAKSKVVLDLAAKTENQLNTVPFPEGVHYEIIQPLRSLFKEEVRNLGLRLGLPEKIVYRQPFPGSGLAIRVLGDVTKAKLETLRQADKIVREEVGNYNKKLYKETGIRDSEHSVWRYFAILPDIQSVGFVGTGHDYEHPIIVRALESVDSMSAEYAKLPYDVLTRIAERIVSEVDGVNRVVYDITSKPPAAIEWE